MSFVTWPGLSDSTGVGIPTPVLSDKPGHVTKLTGPDSAAEVIANQITGRDESESWIKKGK